MGDFDHKHLNHDHFHKKVNNPQFKVLLDLLVDEHLFI